MLSALRRSELVAVHVEDLDMQPDGLLVTVRRSKGDQEGKGQVVPVPRGRRIKPVKLLEAWLAALAAAGITEGPVFHWIPPAGRRSTPAPSPPRGEGMLLGSYDLPQPRGIYWTASPIFLHEIACPRAEAMNEVAPIIRANALVSVRAYDATDQCLYDLGHVCPGTEVDRPLERALGDPRTAFVNIHTARPGCLLSLVRGLHELG